MKGKPVIQEEEKTDEILEYIKDDFENLLILKKAIQLVFHQGKKLKKEDIDKNLKRIRHAYEEIELEEGFKNLKVDTDELK